MDGPGDRRKLVLISNSVCHGRPYLEHCADAIRQFLGGATTITFVPYAAKDWAGYTGQVRSAFTGFGFKVESVHEAGPRPHSLPDNPAIFVGGGNTFRLKAVQDSGLLDQIRQKVLGGMLYMGSSAGANLACPTIKTTNDMPIVQPRDFNALGLVSFQINPHYIDADPSSKHMGETREKRIAEFHEENDLTGLQVAPDEEVFYLNLARAYVTIGDRIKARDILKQLLARQPENAGAKRGLSELSQ